MAGSVPLMCPDVLGAITNQRIHLEWLQYAVGISPTSAYLNQPVSVVVVLQSRVEQNMWVRIGVRPPLPTDAPAAPNISVSKTVVPLGLRPGEVGVLRLPLVPQAPTPPGTYPVQVAVRSRIAGTVSAVARPPDGGVVPSLLTISPIKLNELKAVAYQASRWYQSDETVTTTFDVLEKAIPPLPGELAPMYETLWSAGDMKMETRYVEESAQEAAMFLGKLPDADLYTPLSQAVAAAYARRDISMYPGEVQVVTHLLCYVVQKDLEHHTRGVPVDSRWYRLLPQLVAHHPHVTQEDLPGSVLAAHLLDALLYDAVVVAFELLEQAGIVLMPDATKQQRYADTVLMWLTGRGQQDANYLYTPLVMGGLLVNHLPVVGAPLPQQTLHAILDALSKRQNTQDNTALQKALHIAQHNATIDADASERLS